MAQIPAHPWGHLRRISLAACCHRCPNDALLVVGAWLVFSVLRHSKTKAKGRTVGSSADPKDPGIVYRGSIIGFTADPLSILDKTLEITDPELGGIALAGKVTWFDPERSKYCVVASGLGGSGGGGAISSGGAEPKESCSLWITVDKLVEAKAIGVQKNGKRFALARLPSLEGKDTESGQLGGSMLTEHNDGEGEGGRETGVVSAGDEGETKADTRKREGDASVDLEETGSNEKDAGTTAVGKRRRLDTPPSLTSPSDVAPATHATSHPEDQPRPVRPQLGWQPAAPGEDVETTSLLSPRSEGSKSPTEYKVASTSGSRQPETAEIEKRSEAGTTSPTPQPNRLLPSVQIQEQTDAFTRYPIRGRRTRPESLTFDADDQRGLEGVTSTKRPRLESEADDNVNITASAGPDPSGEELACSGEAAASGDPAHSLPSRVCQAPQAQPTNLTGVARHQRGSVYGLEPGWPHGMDFLGQVPVMRVRAICVTGGGEATYFASAYASIAEGVVCDKRPAPSFSFPFEELENMRLAGGAKQSQGDTGPDSINDPRDLPCESSGGLQGPEGKDKTLDDAETRSTREAEDSRTLLSSEVGQAEEENGEEEAQGEAVAVDQTSNVSPGSADVEDGEISSPANGVADTMRPSPFSEKASVGGSVKRSSAPSEQVGKEGAANGEQTVQPVCQSSNMTGEDESATKPQEVEEMEISSDDVSCGGFEGAEAASPCISEDDDDDDDDIDVRWGVFRVGGSPPKLARVDTQPSDPTRGATSAPPVPPPSTTETTRVLRRPLSVESDEDVETSELCLDASVSDEVEPKGPESDGFDATSADEQELPTTFEEGARPELEQELTAPGKESEIAAVQPLAPQQTGVTLALRSIVREQLQGVLRSASKGEEAALAGGDGNDVLERIASDTEGELFRRLYKDVTGGREYKVS